MSLPRRLFNLLRAEVTARQSEPQEPRLASQEAEEAYQAEQPSQPTKPRPEGGRDARLAGYYANLELPYGSGEASIKAARKRLLKLYHPDKHAADPEKAQLAHVLVQQINHAASELLGSLAQRKDI